MPRKTRKQKNGGSPRRKLRKNPAFDGTLLISDPLASIAGDAAINAACAGFTPQQKIATAGIINAMKATGLIDAAVGMMTKSVPDTNDAGGRPEDTPPEDGAVVSPTKT